MFNKNRVQKLTALLIAVVTLAVFWQVGDFDFVHYDDPVYVSQNHQVLSGLTKESISYAFTSTDASTWHQPLVWLSLMLDTELGGGEPFQYHITNLVLHVFNTLALLLLLSRATGFFWRSAFVAALFAIHPLHVESFAWITERKDVLSTFFWLLALLSYVRYARNQCLSRYLMVVFFFILGLMSKPMVVTLPLTLLLMDIWPLRRMNGSSKDFWSLRTVWPLIREKIPLFVLSLISVVLTLAVHRESMIEQMTVVDISMASRLTTALVAYTAYLVKTFWPTNLAFFYPHPGGILPAWQVAGSVAVLTGISFLAYRCRFRCPYIVVGWLWYVVTLLPVSGIIDPGRLVMMADRFTYVPHIGLFIIVAWGIPDLLASRVRPKGRRAVKYNALLTLTAVAVLVTLARVAHTQTGYWRDDFALFGRAIEVTKDNSLAHYNMGNSLLAKGYVEEASNHYQEAIRIYPKYAESHNNLGAIMLRQGRLDDAIEHFSAAARYKPGWADPHLNLASVLLDKGRIDEAIAHCAEALRLKPDDEEIRRNLQYLESIRDNNP